MTDRDDHPQNSVDPSQPAPRPVFDALSHRRRRSLVLVLAAAPTYQLSLQAIARAIALLEDGTDVATGQITNVRTSLKRSHQHPLETARIVSYQGGDVVPARNFTAALRALAAAYATDRSPPATQ